MNAKRRNGLPRGAPPHAAVKLPAGGVVIDPGAGAPSVEWEIGADQAEPGGLQFEPTRDHLAVRIIKVTKTDGGILVSGSAADSHRSPRGVVLAAGPDCKQVKVGDVIHFPPPPHAQAHPLVRNTGGFLLISEQYVLGIDRRALGPGGAEPPRPDGKTSAAYRKDDREAADADR